MTKLRPKEDEFKEELRSRLQNMPGDFSNFIESCLTWDPEDRIEKGELLNHPYFKVQLHLHHVALEVVYLYVCTSPISIQGSA